MYLVKTVAGQQAFKERHQDFAQRLRSAFLMFDGKRSLAQVLEAISATGVTQEEVLNLVSKGWLATPEQEAGAEDDTGVAVSENSAPSLAPAAVQVASAVVPVYRKAVDAEDSQRRFKKAYPLAVGLTGRLGLKGFRLNLAVEAAMGYEQLVALAPRIREAAGDSAYGELHKALFTAESPDATPVTEST